MARCTDAFGQGWSHMSHLLFRPFRFVFWIKMAILHFLMIIFSSNPASQSNYNVNSTRELEALGQRLIENIVLIVIILMAVILLVILLQFLSAVARILFYDGVREGTIYYMDSFRRNFGKIISYFLWNLIVAIIFSIIMMIILGIILGILFALGVFEGNAPNAPVIVILITAGIGMLLIMFLIMWFYFEMLEGIVVPHMIVKDKGILASWGFALNLVLENLFEFIGFMFFRLLVNIAVGTVVFILAIIFGILVLAASFPFAGQESGMVFTAILMIIIFLPLMVLYSFIFLPVPTFMSSYAYSFIAAIKDDDDYEPNSGLIPKKPSPTPPSEPTEPAQQAYPGNFYSSVSTPQEGPVSFRDLEEFHADSSPSKPEQPFQHFDPDQVNREKQTND